MTMAKTWTRRLNLIVILVSATLFGFRIDRRWVLSRAAETDQPSDTPPSAAATTATADQLLIPREMVDIVHLYNPFRVSKCIKPFCPYDQAQSIAIASMQRAQAKATRETNHSLSIVLAAVTFPDEMDIIPHGFVPLDPLNRSVATEYPNMTIGGVPRRLPFWQDILQSLLTNQKHLRARTIVYTNSDIILHENFYLIVHQKLKEGFKAFTINRQTVGTKEKNGTTHQLYTDEDLDEIFNIPNKELQEHPGTDCFIFPWEMAANFDLDKIFLGYPPFGIALAASLMHYTAIDNFNRNHTNASIASANSVDFDGYRRFVTHETRSTYHLGNDLDWKVDEEHKAYIALNRQIADGMPAVDLKIVFGGRGYGLKLVRDELRKQQKQKKQNP